MAEMKNAENNFGGGSSREKFTPDKEKKMRR
jgi:hypothetical protein